MTNAAIQLLDITEDLATTVRSSDMEAPEDVPESDGRSQLHIFQTSTVGLRTAAQPNTARRSAAPDLAGDHQTPDNRLVSQSPGDDRLLNARQVAEKLGASERWVRDHTTRRSSRIRAVSPATGPFPPWTRNMAAQTGSIGRSARDRSGFSYSLNGPATYRAVGLTARGI